MVEVGDLGALCQLRNNKNLLVDSHKMRPCSQYGPWSHLPGFSLPSLEYKLPLTP